MAINHNDAGRPGCHAHRGNRLHCRQRSRSFSLWLDLDFFRTVCHTFSVLFSQDWESLPQNYHKYHSIFTPINFLLRLGCSIQMFCPKVHLPQDFVFWISVFKLSKDQKRFNILTLTLSQVGSLAWRCASSTWPWTTQHQQLPSSTFSSSPWTGNNFLQMFCYFGFYSSYLDLSIGYNFT